MTGDVEVFPSLAGCNTKDGATSSSLGEAFHVEDHAAIWSSGVLRVQSGSDSECGDTLG